ncbi:hypothetical protein [Streptomyces sp. Tu 3180]|uniref:hypothetical protein n=1 Tax=Streptomyces sp. Tu 3180 TaxID=2682611 RepID=UPI00135B6377|nr:hypothetical protein [Streptomyces sp. Tu 3180]KAF3469188.1 hypothetical protein GL259_36180 [Streptomyces sp. Tu 3180]
MCDRASPAFETSAHLWPNRADAAPSGVPVATLILAEEELPGAQRPPGPGTGTPPPFPPPPDAPPALPPSRPCAPDFRDGCYEVTIRSDLSVLRATVGTLRVDRAAPASGPDGVIVSGDLYHRPDPVVPPLPLSLPFPPGSPFPVDPGAPTGDGRGGTARGASPAATASRTDLPFPLLLPRIPVLPRDRYRSYLRGTRLVVPRRTPLSTPCQVIVDVDEFDYTRPPPGSFRGTFPSTPSRSLRFVLTQVPAAPSPLPFLDGPGFEGRVLEGGIDRGSVTLRWVSGFLRRAVLEIDTLLGAVPPQPVPNAAGTADEFFDTVYATAGWQLTVDHAEAQADVPVPAGVTPDACWSPAGLHALMSSVRKAGTDLDAEWRTHLVVVPATMGCSRGVMYDQIQVPREGSASFSDDGYPDSDSAHFGAAENRRQRDVPRAYLRSAAHEVTHAFNQIHQETETAADNSIMTTTPSVADVLAGPLTGAPGVFPDQISLGFNPTVRNHLAHMPDPVVRPGGWPFASWLPAGAPQAADRNLFRDDELRLEVTAETDRTPLGAPVTVSWKLTNTSGVALLVPDDIRLEALFATMSSSDESDEEKAVRPFVIACDAAKLAPLAPGEWLEADYRVFWSSDGFPLERPGRHTVTVTVAWSAGGVPVGVTGSCGIWVDRPTTEEENRDAALVLHPEVGKWVVLGGDAPHLEEAVTRLRTLDDGAVRTTEATAGRRSRVADAFGRLDLMPRPGES